MTMHKLMLESDGAVLKQLFMKKNIGYVTKSEKNITVLFALNFIVTVVKTVFGSSLKRPYNNWNNKCYHFIQIKSDKCWTVLHSQWSL